MKSRMTADLVTDALIIAIWRRRPDPELLHHSDQGSQYTCEQFQKLLADHGIECSMSRLGECHDNAVMESYFSRMKDDRVSRQRYRTRDEARADTFGCSWHFLLCSDHSSEVSTGPGALQLA
jgi:putative transposase